MKLIVGLGNPGGRYVGTRHNIGFEALDRLAVRLGWTAGPGDFDRLARSNFSGLALDGSVALPSGECERVLLLKPMTYMNCSGNAVAAAAGFYKLSPAEILVLLDDLALPSGRIRLRAGGSSGGHNGLKDIERALGTDRYPRLRIGIDPAPPEVPWREYVLQPFGPWQRPAIEAALDRAASATVTWIEDGIETAMNRYNAEATTDQG